MLFRSAGHVVICDRFADSSVVYQGVARGLKGPLVRELNRIATGGLKPHRTIVLDLDPRIGLARVGSRGTFDRIEKEALGFHQAVRSGFRRLAREEPRRVRLVDATRSQEHIHEAILRQLGDLL